MVINIKGQIRGGKNHMQIDPRSGRHYPNKAWAAWRDAAVDQVKMQFRLMPTICVPCALRINYIPSDKRRRDAPALLDALFHVFERSGLIKDDSLFKEIHWYESESNKEKAGIYATIATHIS